MAMKKIIKKRLDKLDAEVLDLLERIASAKIPDAEVIFIAVGDPENKWDSTKLIKFKNEKTGWRHTFEWVAASKPGSSD